MRRRRHGLSAVPTTGTPDRVPGGQLLDSAHRKAEPNGNIAALLIETDNTGDQ